MKLFEFSIVWKANDPCSVEALVVRRPIFSEVRSKMRRLEFKSVYDQLTRHDLFCILLNIGRLFGHSVTETLHLSRLSEVPRSSFIKIVAGARALSSSRLGHKTSRDM